MEYDSAISDTSTNAWPIRRTAIRSATIANGVPCCTLDLDTDKVEVTESESEDAVRVCCI